MFFLLNRAAGTNEYGLGQKWVECLISIPPQSCLRDFANKL